MGIEAAHRLEPWIAATGIVTPARQRATWTVAATAATAHRLELLTVVETANPAAAIAWVTAAFPAGPVQPTRARLAEIETAVVRPAPAARADRRASAVALVAEAVVVEAVVVDGADSAKQRRQKP